AGCAWGRGSSAAAGFWSARPSGAAGVLPAGDAPSAILPKSAPTATVSPSLAEISDSTPAAGAGTSIVTLSVSSSTSGSSTATASPGCLNHLPIVASVTDSPSAGTRISAMTQSSGLRTTDDGQTTDKYELRFLHLSSVLRPLSSVTPAPHSAVHEAA